MSTELGTWLRTEREERGWTRPELARRLLAAAREAGDKSMPDAQTVRSYIYRWETGITRNITERYVLPFCQVFQIKPAEFGSKQEPAGDITVIQSAAARPAGAGVRFVDRVAYRGIETPEIKQSTVRHEVLMAAHEGSEHAAQAEQHGIGEATLEQLRADVLRLSRQADTDEPFPVFMDMRRIRERIYWILDRRLWPGEQSDLYFLTGVLNGLMGVTADRLGYPDSARELLRAGHTYAIAIDHKPLLAYLRMAQSFVATWHGLPRQGRELATDGLRYISAGSGAADLHIKYATASARIGDMDGARRAVTAAHEARQREHHDDLLEIGGEFSISQATHHYLAGSALGEIHGAEAEAAEETGRAVALYAAGPRPGEQYWFGAKALANVDLAVLQLRSGALDAAATSLQPVLVLTPAQRIESLTERLRLARTELAAAVFRGSAQARNLDEQIEEFTSDSVTAGLHALPGGPA